MAACDTDSLIAQSLCFSECVNIGMQMPILISLAAQIAGVPLDPASLIANSQCFDKCIPDGEKLAVMVYLACQIATGQGACVTPTAPVLSNTATTSTTATFVWTEASDPTLDFLIEWSVPDGGSFPFSQSVPASARTFTITGLQSFTAYQAKIIARNSVTCVSPDSNIVTFITRF